MSGSSWAIASRQTGQVVYSPQTPILTDETAQTLAPRRAKARPIAAMTRASLSKASRIAWSSCRAAAARCPAIRSSVMSRAAKAWRSIAPTAPTSAICFRQPPVRRTDAERASRLIDVHGPRDDDSTSYQVELKILARDRRHLLADVSNAIADEKVSILSGQMTAMKDVTATLIMTIEVTSQNQYDRVLGRIKAVRDIIEVKRGH